MGMVWAGKAKAHTWVILHRQTQKGNDRVCLGIKHAGRGRCGTKRPLEEKVQNIFLNTYLPFIKGEMQRQTVQDSSGTRRHLAYQYLLGLFPVWILRWWLLSRGKPQPGHHGRLTLMWRDRMQDTPGACPVESGAQSL